MESIAVLPGSISYYVANDVLTCMVVQVFIQEHKACEVSLMTHSITCFITSLPFLLLLPCLVAIVIIPLCGLNSSGATSHCFFAMVHVY